jgi:hypothetical protein
MTTLDIAQKYQTNDIELTKKTLTNAFTYDIAPSMKRSQKPLPMI